MSINLEKVVPDWSATGTEPPSSLKTSGFQAGYKPPATYFNWFWSGISAAVKEIQQALLTGLSEKADTDLTNVTNDDFRDKAIDAGVGGLQIVEATSTDGVTYAATVLGVTELTNGLTIVIVPDVVSTSISATLNVNGLGAKYIRQSTTNNNATALTPKNANWMAANKPITLQYDGTQWKTVASRSNASDMNGVLAIANGGTGGELFIKDASISGKKITLKYSDGTSNTLTTQDTTAAAKIPYATCTTGSTTATKVATITNGVPFSLVIGAIVVISSSSIFYGYGSSSTTLKLNVNSTGAKTLTPGSHDNWGYCPSSGSQDYYRTDDTYIVCVYDGSTWRVVSPVTHISRYSGN